MGLGQQAPMKVQPRRWSNAVVFHKIVRVSTVLTANATATVAAKETSVSTSVIATAAATVPVTATNRER